jgi:hypothetical protein
MPNIPDDIFTEPEVSPDTLANLGPLRRLAGVWQSDQGVDINPKAQGPERRVFREHIRMDPIDDPRRRGAGRPGRIHGALEPVADARAGGWVIRMERTPPWRRGGLGRHRGVNPLDQRSSRAPTSGGLVIAQLDPQTKHLPGRVKIGLDPERRLPLYAGRCPVR